MEILKNLPNYHLAQRAKLSPELWQSLGQIFNLWLFASASCILGSIRLSLQLPEAWFQLHASWLKCVHFFSVRDNGSMTLLHFWHSSGKHIQPE